MDSIIVVFANEEARRRIRSLLDAGGFRADAVCSSGSEAIRAVRTLGGGVVVCGFRLGDMTANHLGADLLGLAALLVVSSAANLDLCEGENLYKLASPVSRADFFAMLDLLFRKLRRPSRKRGQEDKALIQRAKEILMDVNRMTEPEAHRFLQKRSMDTGARLTDTAQAVIDAYR